MITIKAAWSDFISNLCTHLNDGYAKNEYNNKHCSIFLANCVHIKNLFNTLNFEYI